MDESASGKTNFYNQEKKLTSEIVPSVLGKETFNNLSPIVGTVTYVVLMIHHSYKGFKCHRPYINTSFIKKF